MLLKDMRTFHVVFFGVTQGYEDISCCFIFSVNQEN